MKIAVKAKTTRTAKRKLFAELSKGMAALAKARQGKRTLRTHVAPTFTSVACPNLFRTMQK